MKTNDEVAAEIIDEILLNEKINKRVDAYITELNTNSVVSRSHITLMHLHKDFGRELVDKILDEKFKEIRESK